MEISTNSLDVGKNAFQIYRTDVAEKIVLRKALRKAKLLPFFSKLQPCFFVIQACVTCRHWACELVCLGHEIRLMP